MLDLAFVRDHLALVEEKLRQRGMDPAGVLQDFHSLDQERRKAIQASEELKARRNQASEEIKSKADRDATVIRAEATRQSEITRGEGDAERSKIYADAYGKDPEFFAFYRSMGAYAASMTKDNTTVVLSPDSAFFHYFQNGPGNGK